MIQKDKMDQVRESHREKELDELMKGFDDWGKERKPSPLEYNDYDEWRDNKLTEVSDEILINTLN